MPAKGELVKVLEAALENLQRSSFKAFKHKLKDCEVPKNHKRIPWNELEEADAPRVVDRIINCHTYRHGPSIVIKVLEDISERQASLDLKIELKKINSKTTRSEKTPGSQKKASK
ncbi:hypothetical protein XENTR_v10023355 [Xenopus tropicalis]|nr:hypothetical protein XENTR_v10023355 [Xenopus tropicalis]|eukprot:XP_012826849.1 PREDICTED: NACHT, LRR and PYD domains-containing protein 6-like [Xenopus tropicalis]